MPVEKRKTKAGIKWRYRGQYKGVSYRSESIYLSKQEALFAEKKRVLEVDEEIRNPKNDIFLYDLMAERLDEIQLRQSQKYYRENKWYFKMLMEELGNTPVSEITKLQIKNLLNKFSRDLTERGKTQHKANGMLRCFKALFSWGIRIYEINTKNPCSGLQYFPIEIKLKYIPPDSEIEAIKNSLPAYQLFLFDFVDQTACRVNEALRLKYEDIQGNLLTLWTHKAKNSNLTPRRIPKPKCLDGKTGEGRVFPHWTDYPRFLEDAVSSLGFRCWAFHNLRHRRASIWASENMPIYEIMQRLGHTNMSTTMNYLQLLGFTRH